MNIILESILMVGSPPFIAYKVTSMSYTLITEHYADKILSPATNVLNSFSFIIFEIWNFILYNIISPIIIIVLTVLFFISQFYLIKGYIYLFKNTIPQFMKAYDYIMGSKKLGSIALNVKKDFSN